MSRDQHILWEPTNFIQKLTCLYYNTFEVCQILFVVLIAIQLPSMVSALFFMIMCGLSFGANMRLIKRFEFGKYYLAFMFFLLFVLLCWKVRMVRNLKGEYKVHKAFRKNVIYYESMGFTLKYDEF